MIMVDKIKKILESEVVCITTDVIEEIVNKGIDLPDNIFQDERFCITESYGGSLCGAIYNSPSVIYTSHDGDVDYTEYDLTDELLEAFPLNEEGIDFLRKLVEE